MTLRVSLIIDGNATTATKALTDTRALDARPERMK